MKFCVYGASHRIEKIDQRKGKGPASATSSFLFHWLDTDKLDNFGSHVLRLAEP